MGYILTVSIHILAAAVWIGGMAFLALAVLPVLRRPAYREVAFPLIYAISVRFRWIGWGAMAVLVVSGIANLAYRGYGWAQLRTGAVWDGTFGRILALKLLLVGLIVVISLIHDVAVGPRVTSLGQGSAGSPEVDRLRRQAAWVGRLVLLLSIAVVVLAVMLVRGVP
jgi:uncharacterized membrane protein